MERIKIDLTPSCVKPILRASQYDNGREWPCEVLKDGTPYIFVEGDVCEIHVRKGDGCGVTASVPVTVGQSSITITSTEQMCAVYGDNIGELVVTNGTKKIGSCNLILSVESDPMNGSKSSNSEIHDLQNQVNDCVDEALSHKGASDIAFDNTDTGLEANNVQSAIEEVNTKTDAKADADSVYDKTYMDGIFEEIDNAFTDVNNALNTKADKANTYTKNEVYTKGEVDTLIDNLPEAMVFKGTLGVGGTIQTLPDASADNEGFTYKVITDGTYAGQSAKAGDVFTSNGSAWVLIPSGDEDNDTWRAIKVEGVEVLGNGISSGAVDFVGSENIEVDFDGDGNKIGVKTKNIYTKNEVDDIVYNILPDDTASGSVANFETDLALPLKSLEVDVNAKQDLHGQSSPYPAGGSAQIWDEEWEVGIWNSSGQKSDSQNAIRCKNYIKINPSETYYVFANFTRYATGIILRLLDANKSFVRTVVVNSSSTKTFTADSNVEYVVWCLSSTDQITTYNNDVSINYPATDTSYHPYSNICPISGWSEISLTKCGANLCDEVFELGSIDNQTGQNVNNPNYCRSKNYIQVPKGVNLYLVNGNSDTLGLRFYDSNKAFIGARAFLTSKVATYGTNDLPTNTAFIRIVDTSTNVYANNISINYPSNDTAYHAYNPNGNTEVINLGGTYYGGHFTQDKDGHRQFVADKGMKTIRDFGAWQYFDSYSYYELTVKDMKQDIPTAYPLNGLISECYATRTASQAGSGNVDCSIAARGQGTTPKLRIKDNKFGSDLSALLNAVGDYKVVYPLETPIIIDLPDGEPINALIGTNNLFADSGDMECSFKCGVAMYVDNHSGGGNRSLAKSGGGETIDEPKEEVKEESKEEKIDEPITRQER